MSGSLLLTAAVGTVLGLTTALLRIPRWIQSSSVMIIPDCVIEEVSRDDLHITEHPVEFGSVISDHAFKRPREVTLRWAWSNTGRYDTFMQDQFLALANLQYSREPFSLFTGKTSYVNMLIASLGATTNSTKEFILETVMVCREVIIVATQATAPNASQSAQQIPQTTSAISPRGNVNLTSQTNGPPIGLNSLGA